MSAGKGAEARRFKLESTQFLAMLVMATAGGGCRESRQGSVRKMSSMAHRHSPSAARHCNATLYRGCVVSCPFFSEGRQQRCFDRLRA
jgi:hypothetical protein